MGWLARKDGPWLAVNTVDGVAEDLEGGAEADDADFVSDEEEDEEKPDVRLPK